MASTDVKPDPEVHPDLAHEAWDFISDVQRLIDQVDSVPRPADVKSVDYTSFITATRTLLDKCTLAFFEFHFNSMRTHTRKWLKDTFHPYRRQLAGAQAEAIPILREWIDRQISLDRPDAILLSFNSDHVPWLLRLNLTPGPSYPFSHEPAEHRQKEVAALREQRQALARECADIEEELRGDENIRRFLLDAVGRRAREDAAPARALAAEYLANPDTEVALALADLLCKKETPPAGGPPAKTLNS
jgi:hypothetical protein